MSARLEPAELLRRLRGLEPSARRALVIALARLVIEQEAERTGWRDLRGERR